VRQDETAVICGAGPMGLLWVALLKRAGVRRIISVDLAEGRRRMAEGLGADVSIDAVTEDPVAMVETETEGRGADLAVEMIGRPGTFEKAVLSVGPGGREEVMGVARREDRAQIGPFELMVKEVEVLGSNANAAAFIPAIRLIEAGAIRVEDIVSDELAISEALDGFGVCRSGKGAKVMIRPG